MGDHADSPKNGGYFRWYCGTARRPFPTWNSQIPYAPNSIRRAETSDQSSGPNGVIRPPACQNELAPGPAGRPVGKFSSPYGSHNLLGPNRLRHCRAAQGVTDCHSPSGFAMTMVIDGWCFFIGRAEFPKPRIPYAERILATGRVGPMVSFGHRPARTNWLPALPGDRSGSFTRLKSSNIHQSRVWHRHCRSGGFTRLPSSKTHQSRVCQRRLAAKTPLFHVKQGRSVIGSVGDGADYSASTSSEMPSICLNRSM